MGHIVSFVFNTGFCFCTLFIKEMKLKLKNILNKYYKLLIKFFSISKYVCIFHERFSRFFYY